MLEVGCTITFPLCSKAGTVIYFKFNIFFYIEICEFMHEMDYALFFQAIEDMSIQANVPALAMEEV
jgi:hypothetical protein